MPDSEDQKKRRSIEFSPYLFPVILLEEEIPTNFRVLAELKVRDESSVGIREG